MGDRTWCYLNLLAPVTKEQYAEVLRISNDELGREQGPGSFEFEEVNYAEMPKDLEGYLFEEGIAFSWIWQDGDGYGAGGNVWNTLVMTSYAIHSELGPVVAIDHLEDLADTIRAVDFLEQGRDAFKVLP